MPPLTIHDAPDLALLAGRLAIAYHFGTRGGRPYLQIIVRCPWCRTEHAHRWSELPATYEPEAAIRRRSHCREASRFAGRDYLIQPDPFDALGNARLVEQANRQFARWQTNRRLREEQARQRDLQSHADRERAKWSGVARYDPPGTLVGVRTGPPRDNLAGGLARIGPTD